MICTAPPSLLQDQFEADGTVRLIEERSGVLLSNSLQIDAYQPGCYNSTSALNPGQIAPGSRVNSYLLHFDPATNGSGIFGTLEIKFDRPILGVMALASQLNASDDIVGLPGVMYPQSLGKRGLELNASGQTDSFEIMPDGLTIRLAMDVMQVLDECRIVTGQAPSSIGLYDTGVDDLGAPLAPGSIDSHYLLSGPISPAQAISKHPAYVSPPVGSSWISPRAGNVPVGDYSYALAFDLSGEEASRIVVRGSLAADNRVVVYLNGLSSGVETSSYSSLTAFSIASGFIEGLNVLDFVVTNTTSSPNPSGLLVANLRAEIDAFSIARNPGTNPNSYTAGTISIGKTFTATVDRSQSNKAASLLFGYDTAVSITLTGGQQLLCFDGSGSGEIFTGANIAPQSTIGSVDHYTVAVPPIASLAGFEFCSQAVEFLPAPFVLSNAYDHTIGNH